MCFFGKKKKKKEEEARLIQEKVAKEKEAQEKEAEKTSKEEQKETPKKQVAQPETKETSKETKAEPKAKKTPAQSKQKESAEEEVEENKEPARKSMYRVIFDKEDKMWKIKKDGAKRVIDSKKTKEEALARVQELSKSQDAKFVVYKKDGKFQKKANLNLKNNDEE